MTTDFDIKRRTPKPSRSAPDKLTAPPVTLPQGGIGGIVPKPAASAKSRPQVSVKRWLTWRTLSRIIFGLALLAIVGVVVHFTFIPDTDQVNRYATYAFFLLVMGTISLALETRHR